MKNYMFFLLLVAFLVAWQVQKRIPGIFGDGQVVGGAALLALGIVVLVIWRKLRESNRRSLTWPAAPGHIVESKLEENSDESGSSLNAHVVYRYEIGGTAFQASSLGATGMQTARDLVLKYRVGQPVSVFYDPSDPARAVLERNGSSYAIILAMSILVLIGGTCLISFGTLR